MIERYSSRKVDISKDFLQESLKGAIKYDRIAGYFSSSILELIYTQIETMEGQTRIICNSSLYSNDIKTAQKADKVLKKEWYSNKPEKETFTHQKEANKLYTLLINKKIEIKVLPNNIMGLIHGKAGVITYNDSNKKAFIGSANETYNAYKNNYELVWTDSSIEGINWIQEEFNALWNHPDAIDLSNEVIHTLKRLGNESNIDIKKWRNNPKVEEVLVETPIDIEGGFWTHQKYFIQLAFDNHVLNNGARFVLADTVGLGKTIQLASIAKLIAIYENDPILIIVPKTLVTQWQKEIREKLNIPSARWENGRWIDDNEDSYRTTIKHCPKKIGIISQGLITSSLEVVNPLLNNKYGCVIVDESHRAGRCNLQENKENIKAEPNNLMKFLLEISKCTKSMILATATPVQMNPIQAYDLLSILNNGDNRILGTYDSKWNYMPKEGLDLISNEDRINRLSDNEIFSWMKNPFPYALDNRHLSNEDKLISMIRNSLGMTNNEYILPLYMDNGNISYIDNNKKVKHLISSKFEKLSSNTEYSYLKNSNPYIRTIIRRKRNFLEETINPKTGLPYLERINIKLYGEDDNDSIETTAYIEDAFIKAEEFAKKYPKKGSGFIKTLLLRRLSSSVKSGLETANRMLKSWNEDIFYEDTVDNDDIITDISISKPNNAQKQILKEFISILEANNDYDPKYEKVLDLLLKGHSIDYTEPWLNRGCILFSQYYDTAKWFSKKLSLDISGETIGVYSSDEKSGIFKDGVWEKTSREYLKESVTNGRIKIIVGTDSASEGLNLQSLGSLINIDLPWNPSRLEQRKGRIQRSGQKYDDIYIYNMRYKGSVEDNVHKKLSYRLKQIHDMFGEIPSTLKSVWITYALEGIEEAKKKINDAEANYHPFELKYEKDIPELDWISTEKIVNKKEISQCLNKSWNNK